MIKTIINLEGKDGFLVETAESDYPPFKFETRAFKLVASKDTEGIEVNWDDIYCERYVRMDSARKGHIEAINHFLGGL